VQIANQTRITACSYDFIDHAQMIWNSCTWEVGVYNPLVSANICCQIWFEKLHFVHSLQNISEIKPPNFTVEWATSSTLLLARPLAMVSAMM